MTQDKAREFFSAYYEESLEAGLRQQFEQRLRADATLREEYASFVSALESLDLLRDEVIETPVNLRNRIDARLDAVQTKTRKPAFWNAWLNPIAFGGVAVLAILGGLLAVRPSDNSGASVASLGLPEVSVPSYKVTGSEGAAHIDATQGVSVGGAKTTPQADLKNDGPSAKAFDVTVGKEKSIVIVPGTERVARRSGNGDLEAFGKALSDTFGVVVTLSVEDPKQVVAWEFDSRDALSEATHVLSGLGLTADLAKDGALTIQRH